MIQPSRHPKQNRIASATSAIACAIARARYDPFNTMYIPLSQALDFIDVAQLQSSCTPRLHIWWHHATSQERPRKQLKSWCPKLSHSKSGHGHETSWNPARSKKNAQGMLQAALRSFSRFFLNTFWTLFTSDFIRGLKIRSGGTPSKMFKISVLFASQECEATTERSMPSGAAKNKASLGSLFDFNVCQYISPRVRIS